MTDAPDSSHHGMAELAPGTVVAGKLRVVRILGVGGMGAVYEVEHEFTRHRRALKLLHGEFAQDPEVVARFLREASAAGRIGSPHIVETYDAGRLETGEPYLVMEMLSGKAVADLLEERGRLAVDEALELLIQACAGVQAAHDAGIVHRDLKPDNLFFTRDGLVKLLDFGISKFDPSRTDDLQLTQEGSTMGTPFYMPPEQARGVTSIDGRADIYALGVVLYECITGEKPFTATTLPELIIKIHEGKFPPASSRVATPREVDAIIARAMDPDPAKRFASAAEFASELRRLREGSLAAVKSPPAPDRTEWLQSTSASSSSVPSPLTPFRGSPDEYDHTGAPEAQRGGPTMPAAVYPVEPIPRTLAAAAPVRGGKPRVGIALVLVAVVAFGVGWWVLRGAADADQKEQASSEPSTPKSPAAPPEPPSAGEEATTDVSSRPGGVAPSASAVTSEAPEPLEAETRAVAPRAPAVSKKSSTGDSRSQKHGLAQENPFD